MMCKSVIPQKLLIDTLNHKVDGARLYDSSGSSISQTEEPAPKGGVSTYYLAKFSQKLHGNGSGSVNARVI